MAGLTYGSNRTRTLGGALYNALPPLRQFYGTETVFGISFSRSLEYCSVDSASSPVSLMNLRAGRMGIGSEPLHLLQCTGRFPKMGFQVVMTPSSSSLVIQQD